MPYRPAPGTHDEALAADGAWRAHAAGARAALEGRDLAALVTAVRDRADRDGVRFASPEGSETFMIDPVPRVVPAAEWDRLQRGLAQRVLALDAFVADVHGDRRCVAEGAIPARVIERAGNHEPRARELRPPAGVWIGIAGLDVVRAPDGRLLVLEDNVRTPSGLAYAVATRRLVGDALGGTPPCVRAVDGASALLAATLRGAAPPGVDEPYVVVLTDGPSSSAYWEHMTLADWLGAPLVTPGDLTADSERLRHDGRDVDVVYRRTDDDGLDAPAGRLLRGPLAAGTIGVVNGFGTGVADDKLVHAYVEDLVRLYLGEEPLLDGVRTLDLERPDDLAEALDRLDEFVVKPRDGSGGNGVVLAPDADAAGLDALRDRLRAAPADHVVQELVPLSTHPTVSDGRLEPRHVDLRPFVFLTGQGDAHVLPGGLTRVALRAGDMVVNSSQDGGAKDTWVLDA